MLLGNLAMKIRTYFNLHQILKLLKQEGSPIGFLNFQKTSKLNHLTIS